MPLLNQVVQWNSTSPVAPGGMQYERYVRDDQLLESSGVASLDPFGQRSLFISRKTGHPLGTVYRHKLLLIRTAIRCGHRTATTRISVWTIGIAVRHD
jgi:hypothetical protein